MIVGALAGWNVRHGVVSLHYEINDGGGFPALLTYELGRVNGELVLNVHSGGYADAASINVRGDAAIQRLKDAEIWLDFPTFLRRG